MNVDRRGAILEAAARVIARRGVRGLRVEEVAQEASVSTALLYYHFEDRAGLLKSTLEFINDKANSYTEAAIQRSAGARDELEQLLLLELQDRPTVVENSRAWGELRASAVFDPTLQAPLRASSENWSRDVSAAIRRVIRDESLTFAIDPDAAADRLTALVEGLSERWLSHTISLNRARNLLGEAIKRELLPLPATRQTRDGRRAARAKIRA